MITRALLRPRPWATPVTYALRCAHLSGTSGVGGEAPPPPPPPPPPKEAPSLLYRLREDFKDILSVTFGWERARNLEEELDKGLRVYPWITYSDPVSGKALYRNTETGAVTEMKPLDFDRRATPDAFRASNVEASALMAMAPQLSPWERTIKALGSTPIIQQLMALGDEVAKGPVGQAAGSVKTKLGDIKEDLQEKWETSQHPVIVNAAYVVDSVMAETEQGRAIRDIKAIDTGFDEYTFVAEMRDSFIPLLARAFFRIDTGVLTANCTATAMAQMAAVAAARAAEGLEHDGTILSVSKVELIKATQIEDAKGGNTPLLLLSSQVQYIHAVRNKAGEVVEGSDSEIRMAVFILAVTREWNPEKGSLTWKAMEVAMHGSQLYL